MTPMRLWSVTFAVLVASSFAALADEVVIKAAKVYTGAGAPLTPGMVHVKDGKITAVAAKIDVPNGTRVIDLGAGSLIPGLIDAHSSIGVDGGAAESTQEVTPNFRVLDAIDWSARAFRQARADGVTTVALVPGTDNVIGGLSCVVKTAGEAKKRVVAAEHSLVVTLASDPASGNNSRSRPDSIYNRQPTNRMGVVWILRQEFGRARAAGGSGNGALRDAIAGKRPVLCVSRTEVDIVAALRLQKEYSIQLTLAGGQEAYKVRQDVAAAKVPIFLSPLNSAGGAGPEQTEIILNIAGNLHEASIPIALTGGKLLEQARLAVRFGLPKDAALAAVTATPAKLLGLDARLG